MSAVRFTHMPMSGRADLQMCCEAFRCHAKRCFIFGTTVSCSPLAVRGVGVNADQLGSPEQKEQS